MTLMTEPFYITFGDQYRRIQHPKAINDVYPHPDGWMTLDAMNLTHAMQRAKSVFGDAYSMCYTKEEFTDEVRAFFPKGELAHLTFERGAERFA